MISNDTRYLRLLEFARISQSEEDDPDSPGEYEHITALLNSSSMAELQRCRAFLPLVYASTGRHNLRMQLQPAVLHLLHDQSLRLMATEMGYRRWLLTHLGQFEQRGIPVILLKGAAFAGTIYPENAPRLGIDLDILVRQEDFSAACKLLGETMNSLVLATDRAATHAALFERVFVAKDGQGPTIELHRELTNPYIFTIDQSSLWAASRRHPGFNLPHVRILAPEDTLLHLAVHACRDLDFCSHNLLDMHEVWCQWQPDLARLSQRARDWGARTVLWLLLANGRKIMHTPVPDVFLDSLRPNRIRQAINQRIFQGMAKKSDGQSATTTFRCLQLLSQLSLPDHPLRGLHFQLFYARLRLHDWLLDCRDQIRWTG